MIVFFLHERGISIGQLCICLFVFKLVVICVLLFDITSDLTPITLLLPRTLSSRTNPAPKAGHMVIVAVVRPAVVPKSCSVAGHYL